MNILRGQKRKTAWLLILMMLFTWVPLDGINLITSHALVVGSDAEGNMVVSKVTYSKQHTGFSVASSYIEIQGTNLTGVSVLFKMSSGDGFTGGFTSAGTLATYSSDALRHYDLNITETSHFLGEMIIGDQTINLSTSGFPNVQGANKLIVNQDEGDDITFSGNYLDTINQTTTVAKYGTGIFASMGTTTTPTEIALNNPTAPDQLGYQDIYIKKTDTVSDPDIEVEYYYTDAFRIIKNLNLTNLTMYPTAAAKGDSIFLTADNFNDNVVYGVYFLAEGETYADYNKSPSVTLSADKAKLTVQVPNNVTIASGSKTVKVVQFQSGEIIAEMDVTDTFSLIEASSKPIITRVNPEEGPDTGSPVQIKGRNLLTLSLPNLTGYTGINTVVYSDGDHQMDVTYALNGASFQYQGNQVTSATRTVRATIGDQATFERDNGAVKYTAGVDDFVYVETAAINDAATDPIKDVLLEITTTLVTGAGTYTFAQSALAEEAYTFIPSSIEPEITEVNPNKVHITATKNMKENTLISIEGSNFFVNKYTDNNGVVHTNYPVVLIQNADSLGTNSFQFLFDKNGDPDDLSGRIYLNSDYHTELDPESGTYLKVGADAVPVDMVVLNDDNEVVDGTVGNDTGTRIVLYLPTQAVLDAGGKKNIQVINPSRESDELGYEGIALDIIDFIAATDTPVIESVSPNIVTVEGGDEVVVTGTNFQEGIKVYLDGVEVANVTRTIDVQGNDILLTFAAPEGRLGKTQLALVNPLGGLAVRDFYYVSSYNKDPEIDAISPNKGSADTLAVITGDNYFKPDPTVDSDAGVNAFRLIGSRVFMDGKDVNSYNKDVVDNIDFELYTAPDAEVLFTADAANDRVRTSVLYRNAVITDSSDGVYTLNFDANGDPELYTEDSLTYSLKVDSGDNLIHSYEADGTDQGTVTVTETALTLGDGTILDVEMDNNILAIGRDASGNKIPRLADYWYSVVFSNAAEDGYFTLERLFDGTVRLSNGQLNKYTIVLNGAENGFVAVSDSGGQQNLTVTDDSITLVGEALTLDMRTPYVYDGDRIITGNRVQVISKYQIQFTVPLLTSGQGYKDVAVENPDTKRATLADGFYYYANPATSPAISSIVPNEGSVNGGFLITINGKDFQESSKVYIDGVVVPTADTSVNLGGTALTVKVPKYGYTLSDYDTDRITVPVVVLNQDGGSAVREDGFTYVNPASTPSVSSIVTNNGSTVGGEIVEITGYDFRYFEPYVNEGGGSGYDVGIDTFTNLNGYLSTQGVTKKWDNLAVSYMDGAVDLREPLNFPNNATYSFYSQYYSSPILPKVYFGTKEAKIVDFASGYLKVVTPANTAGAVDVYVVNNDSGISNKLAYTYKSSSPKITYINPAQGARIGQETRDIFGSGFAQYLLPGYTADDDTDYAATMPGVEALVRFADITNRGTAIGTANDGRINAERATVSLEGDLSISYRGDLNQIIISVLEGGTIYTRTFSGYDDQKLFIPMGMLKSGASYYVPDGYNDDGTVYNTDTDYELILVEVDAAAKRFYVERGYAPQTDLLSSGRVTLDTPSYYTIGQVNVTLTNPDGGVVTTKYTYRNPDSAPTIELINPQSQIPSENAYMVEGTVKGGTGIEIKGHDFRDGVKVYLDQKEMEVLDITVDNSVPSDPLDVIIAKIPAGTDADIGVRYPIVVENTDGGIANSTDPKTLTSDDQWPIYFIYRKPLSDPVILTVTPEESSVYVNSSSVPVHGNEIILTGTDFRSGAMVIIGSIGGVPVTPHYIEDEGRVLKFYIPPNLTVGAKDLQVINADFGTGILANGLKIISYPQVTGIKSADGASEVEWVSVEGGTKIRINGSGFDSTAKVYFGGTRTQLTAATTDPNMGLWRDNNYYAVTDGTAAQAVEFVDSTALTVTVPQVFKEKEFTITIINGDTGISDGDTTIKYSVPVPSAPLNLDAEIVNNKYIKLFGYTSSNYDYFEIYTFIGSKSVSKLEDNNYKDFNYLATATTEPYKITRLEGLDKMDKDDKVFIVLKAVNKYGPSDWSNIAYLKYSEVDDIRGGLGIEDFDGNLDVPAGQAFGTEVAAAQAVVTISKTDLKNMTTIPMTDTRFTAVQKTIVNIPEAVVASNYNLITLQMKQGRIKFYPALLNTFRFQQIAGGDKLDTYGNLTFEPVTTEYAGLIQRYIPREMKAFSQPYRVGISAASNAGVTELSELTGSMEVALNYLSPLPVGYNPAVLRLYWYDAAASRWMLQYSTYDTLNRLVTGQVSRPGVYIVLGPR